METEEWDFYDEEKASPAQLNFSVKSVALVDGREMVRELGKDPLDIGDQIAPIIDSHGPFNHLGYEKYVGDKLANNDRILGGVKFNSIGRRRVVDLLMLKQSTTGKFQKSIASVASTIGKRKYRKAKSSLLSAHAASDSGYEDPDWLSKREIQHKSEKLSGDRVEQQKLLSKRKIFRCRQKRKMKVDEIIRVHEELQDQNQSLKSQLVKLTCNIECLRKFVRDQFMKTIKSETSCESGSFCIPLVQKVL